MQITIEKLIYGGSGMGEIDGKKVFVPYSAPGDVLDIKITADHGSFLEAEIVSVIDAAPCRVSPPCPVFGKCGGCQWQHIPYKSQIEWKRTILLETLERIGKIKSPNVLETLASPKEWNYRNRIQLHVDSKGHVGFYRPRSKEVVEFETCAIADERLNKRLTLERKEIAKRDRGIALRVEEGPPFAQVNTEQNEQLKGMVIGWLEEVPHKTVLELYAGAGNFTFAIAKIAEHVVASDIDGSAIRTAKKRQEELGVSNIEFLCAPAGRIIKRFPNGCDAVLVDPPRKGCAEAIEVITSANPKSILYISCDPSTLARDVELLDKKGFKLVKTLPVDMFPQTFHIESLSLFEKL